MRIVALQTGLPVALLVVRKRGFGQLHHTLAVKRDVVLAQPGKRQPRLQQHAVPGKTAIGAQQAELAHIAVEIAQAAVVAHHADAHHAPHHGAQGDMGVVGQQFHLEAKVARQRFLRLQGIDQQHGIGGTIAMRKIQAQQTPLLRSRTEGGQCRQDAVVHASLRYKEVISLAPQAVLSPS